MCDRFGTCLVNPHSEFILILCVMVVFVSGPSLGVPIDKDEYDDPPRAESPYRDQIPHAHYRGSAGGMS